LIERSGTLLGDTPKLIAERDDPVGPIAFTLALVYLRVCSMYPYH
jgi:hypothetical protein